MSEYNFASCLIQKNMATIQVSTYCYLKNPAEFHAQNKSIHSVWWGDSLCVGYRARQQMNGTQFANLLSKGTKFFAVIRDPFDRFVSGYVDKCFNELDFDFLNESERCFGCFDDLRCFLDAVYRLLVDYQAGKIAKLTHGTTLHSTRGSLVVDTLRHRVRNDPYVSEMLMRMYYYDFVEFGFNNSSTKA
ncbi:unnamed protein product [Nippostrongylus brasiliensis]|uniref:Sulfotransfer_1 domain-containing protein n=1 Tax=Nippostrongylus brasiliensis TaxID=27835 RepID=A0A0N4Y8W8_NIPBR|nr:unnamed protein product [Nippostrongylus brasiliensis]